MRSTILTLYFLFELVFGNNNLLVINQFAPSSTIPSFENIQESIQIKFGSRFQFFTSNVEQPIIDLIHSSENSSIAKIRAIRELGETHKSNFILVNTLEENEVGSLLNGQLYSVRSGGIIQEKSVQFLNYSDGVFNELLLWAGDIFQKVKDDLVNERDALLFPNPDEIVLDKTPFGAMMRSFAVPGWGQFYSENKTSGIIWSSFESLLIAGILFSYSKYDESVKQMNLSLANYNLSENENDIIQLRNQVQTYHTDHITFNNYIMGISAGATSSWMANAIHAYLTGPRPEINIYGPNVGDE